MSTPAGMLKSGRATMHRHGYPLIALVRRDLRRRYAATMLGVSWTLVQPLVLIGLYVVVFAFILRIRVTPGGGPADFTLYLLAGMLPYLAISEGIQRASSVLQDNRSLVDRTLFPAVVLPAASVAVASVTEVAGLTLLVLAAALFDRLGGVWLLLLPVLMVLRVLLTLGFAWIASVLTVFVGDVREGMGLALTAWLFLTPIFYTTEAVPAGLRWLLLANPLHPLLVCYRAALFGTAPPPLAWVSAVIWSAVIAAVGLTLFQATIARAKDLL